MLESNAKTVKISASTSKVLRTDMSETMNFDVSYNVMTTQSTDIRITSSVKK
ncbi:MAG: hypothetical protein ACYDAJ_07025 [Nitrosotalea sp.]